MADPVEGAFDENFLSIKPDFKGMLVWRVEEFNLNKWTDFGAFYTGDSYLVFHAYTKGTSQRIIQDIYFWLGSESTTDETGTAALKAVNLDDYFGGAPIQHREVQYHESNQFRALFEQYGGIRYMDGGIDSGFRKVDTDTSVVMYQVKGAKNPVLQQVPPVGTSLNHGDVFIVHRKGQFWIWMGKKANRMEKVKGVQVLNNLRSSDPRANVERLDDSETTSEFWEALGGETEISSAEDAGSDKEFELSMVKSMVRLNGDAFEKVPYGKESLSSDGLFIIAAGKQLLCWVGKNSDKEAARTIILAATKYLNEAGLPEWCPISVMREGTFSEAFEVAFA